MPRSVPNEKVPTKAKRKRVPKTNPLTELVEAIANVVADRVVAKLVEREKAPVQPERVPVWLSLPREPGSRKRTKRPAGERTIDQMLRDAGLVKMGDPGYDAALREYLSWKRAHDAEIAARAQLRRAARLLGRYIERGTGGEKP